MQRIEAGQSVSAEALRAVAAAFDGGGIHMHDKRIALVTGANQGVGLQVAKELVANGVTVLVGSRNFERGDAAAKEIGPGASCSS